MYSTIYVADDVFTSNIDSDTDARIDSAGTLNPTDVTDVASSTKIGESNPFFSHHHEIQMRFNNEHLNSLVETNDFEQKFKSEWSIYMSLPLLNYNENPIAEWKNLKGTCPLLFKLAEKYCVVMGSSVASERMFSTSGRIVQTRSSLAPERLSKLVVLHSINDTLYQQMLREME